MSQETFIAAIRAIVTQHTSVSDDKPYCKNCMRNLAVEYKEGECSICDLRLRLEEVEFETKITAGLDLPSLPAAISQNMTLAGKVATYEHIDVVRKMLRLMATEIVIRGETHDRSKLSDAEAPTFGRMTPRLAGSTYGSAEYHKMREEMAPALEHHYANNRHHPEHHEDGISGMNLLDVLEMWCDWYASGQRHENGSMERSIQLNKSRFLMGDQLTRIFENTLRDLKSNTLSSNRPQRTKTGG